MLTGTLPFDGSTVAVLMMHVHDPPPSLSERRREHVDPALEGLIMRAMAKDPAQRHPSMAAFRYELNTVMDMLELGRRRRPHKIDSGRDANLVAVFERSRMPQALVSFEGRIVQFNQAFADLVGRADGLAGLHVSETALADAVPGFLRAVRACHVDGRSHERKARVQRGDGQPPLELTLWFCPLPIPGSEVHLMIRLEDADLRSGGS
jgi:hypothetical protein